MNETKFMLMLTLQTSNTTLHSILTLRLLRGSRMTQWVQGSSRPRDANPMTLSPIMRSRLIRSNPYSRNRRPIPGTSSEARHVHHFNLGHRAQAIKAMIIKCLLQDLEKFPIAFMQYLKCGATGKLGNVAMTALFAHIKNS